MIDTGFLSLLTDFILVFQIVSLSVAYGYILRRRLSESFANEFSAKSTLEEVNEKSEIHFLATRTKDGMKCQHSTMGSRISKDNISTSVKKSGRTCLFSDPHALCVHDIHEECEHFPDPENIDPRLRELRFRHFAEMEKMNECCLFGDSDDSLDSIDFDCAHENTDAIPKDLDTFYWCSDDAERHPDDDKKDRTEIPNDDGSVFSCFRGLNLFSAANNPDRPFVVSRRLVTEAVQAKKKSVHLEEIRPSVNEQSEQGVERRSDAIKFRDVNVIEESENEIEGASEIMNEQRNDMESGERIDCESFGCFPPHFMKQPFSPTFKKSPASSPTIPVFLISPISNFLRRIFSPKKAAENERKNDCIGSEEKDVEYDKCSGSRAKDCLNFTDCADENSDTDAAPVETDDNQTHKGEDGRNIVKALFFEKENENILLKSIADSIICNQSINAEESGSRSSALKEKETTMNNTPTLLLRHCENTIQISPGKEISHRCSAEKYPIHDYHVDLGFGDCPTSTKILETQDCKPEKETDIQTFHDVVLSH